VLRRWEAETSNLQKHATETCIKNTQQKHATKTCNKNMQQKHATKTCIPSYVLTPTSSSSLAQAADTSGCAFCFLQKRLLRALMVRVLMAYERWCAVERSSWKRR
jgi:butyrate kinase